MSELARCLKCGAELPPGSPAGACPKCLLALGLESPSASNGLPSSVDSPTVVYQSGAPLPDVAELSALLPAYEFLRLLGRGGMGAVYLARQPNLDRLVAIKVLPPATADVGGFAERFAREARALARLNHPGIVTVYDFGQTRGQFYFVMEYVDGTNLRQLIRSGPLEPQQALTIVPQICEALQFAHNEGVVHRDIKPENVLIDQRGRIKIADFGLAKLVTTGVDSTLTGTHQAMGTPIYMAPEQIERPSSVDHRADIYALGVVFYELLTGELPIGRFAPPSHKVQIDVRLDDVVLRSLEKEPERRYQHASDLKQDVDRLSHPGGPPQPAASSPLNVGALSDKAVLAVEAQKLEATLLKHLPNDAIGAYTAFLEVTGANAATAREAVNVVASKHGHIIPFPTMLGKSETLPKVVKALILPFLAVAVAVGAFLWISSDVNPVLRQTPGAIAVLFLGFLAWRTRGTPAGHANVAGFLVFFAVFAYPWAFDLLEDPTPLLQRIYAATGVEPGKKDALFIQLALGGLAVVAILWWYVCTKLAQGKRDRAQQLVSMIRGDGPATSAASPPKTIDEVKRRVHYPSIAIACIAATNSIGALLLLLSVRGNLFHNDWILYGILLAYAIVMFSAVRWMRQLRAFPLALVSAMITAVMPPASMLFPVTIGVSLWAFSVLLHPDVRSAFGKQ